MKVFIDWLTGTWGDATDIVVVDATPALLDFLDNASDADIREFAEAQRNKQRGVSEVLNLIEPDPWHLKENDNG